MSRTAERLIDLFVLWTLLGFAYAMRQIQPLATGVVLSAAVQFWLVKNAHMPDPVDPVKLAASAAAARTVEAAAEAAAAVLATAKTAAVQPKETP